MKSVEAIIGMTLGGIGLLFVAVAMIFALKTRDFRSRAVVADGQVIDLVSSWSTPSGRRRKSGSYHPVVKLVKVRRARWLMEFGEEVKSVFQSVELNARVRINGRNPWRIYSQWEGSSTGRAYAFSSENLWFNPE